MSWRSKICCVVGLWALFGATAAWAQRLHSTQVFLSSAPLSPDATGRLISFYGSDDRFQGAPAAGVDYAVFAAELVAYLTMRFVPNSVDEYRDSLLGSRLSPTVPSPRSEFGHHCLQIVTRLGSAMRGSFPALESVRPSSLALAARAGSTALVARELWLAFKNNVEDNPHGFSLKPKVGGGRFSVKFTLRW